MGYLSDVAYSVGGKVEDFSWAQMAYLKELKLMAQTDFEKGPNYDLSLCDNSDMFYHSGKALIKFDNIEPAAENLMIATIGVLSIKWGYRARQFDLLFDVFTKHNISVVFRLVGAVKFDLWYQDNSSQLKEKFQSEILNQTFFVRFPEEEGELNNYSVRWKTESLGKKTIAVPKESWEVVSDNDKELVRLLEEQRIENAKSAKRQEEIREAVAKVMEIFYRNRT